MPPALLDPDNVERARRAGDRGLCDHCLGRLFGKVETGLTNPQRSARLRAATGAGEVEPAACHVCEGLFGELDRLAAVAAEALAPFEFTRYLIGTKVDADVLAREQTLAAELGCENTEPANSELNREIGKRVAHLRPGIDVEFRDPEVTAVVDTRFDHVTLQHGGLFLYGRYRKFDRGIPQTVWPCRRCRGRGCETCGRTGKQYMTSVQELVQGPALEASGATQAAFHGAGREDIDARMLGSGRPFVLELKDPKVRSLDLAALVARVNQEASGRAEVDGLRFARKAEVQHVKEFHGRKTYRAHVQFDGPVAAETLNKAIAALRGCAIAQRTPSRVEHRRADLVRERVVQDVTVEGLRETAADLVIVGDAGLYIKELVSGDEGRTQPSLAGLLGVPARVRTLDVLDVQYEDAGAKGTPRGSPP